MHVLRGPAAVSADTFSVAVDRTDASRASLSASGELDLAAVQDLGGLLAKHEGAGRTFICLDLSAVTFMDCSCLRILVDAHVRLRAAGGQLILARPSGPVLRLLSVTHLDGTLLAAVDGDLPVDLMSRPGAAWSEQLVSNDGAA